MSPPVVSWAHPATHVPEGQHDRYDGDTFKLRLDLGTYAGAVKLDPVVKIRLKGIDCWELHDPNGKGKQARDICQSYLKDAFQIIVATDKPDPESTFNRTPAEVWIDLGTGELKNLADLLRAEGCAKPPGQEHLG